MVLYPKSVIWVYFGSEDKYWGGTETKNIKNSLFQEIILSSGFFRRETASGFYPWGNVEGPRKRVAEGLCGWRHGNSFPMTQSAQSHSQMRSIPHCSKAVFYVFVFYYIHDSATMYNHCPSNFPLRVYFSGSTSFRWSQLGMPNWL